MSEQIHTQARRHREEEDLDVFLDEQISAVASRVAEIGRQTGKVLLDIDQALEAAA